MYLNNVRVRKILCKIYYVLGFNSKSVKGRKNKIDHSEALLKNVTFDIIGNNNEIIVKKASRISNVKILLRGSDHKLIIEEKCTVKSGVFWFEDSGCTISIGGNTTIEDAHIAVTEPNSTISLGEDCMLSSGIDIRNGDSHSIIDIESKHRLNYARDISIRNHVWIGAHAQILKGVTIGSHSIVGVRSLVTKDIPEHSIAAGTPAKVVKTNITWDRKRTYD